MSNPFKQYSYIVYPIGLQKDCCLHCSEVIGMSTLAFQGGVILRTFVADSGFGTYAMLTIMVILP